MSMSWEDRGLSASLERVLAASQDVQPDLAEGARAILDESNSLIPKESGDLAATGSVKEDRGGNNTVGIGYDSVYAHWIHEHLGFKHPHGGQAKFLETAMLTKGPEALNKAGESLWRRAT